MTVRITCLVLPLMLLAAGRAAAAPGDDSFIAGYAAAVLEREFSIRAVISATSSSCGRRPTGST